MLELDVTLESQTQMINCKLCSRKWKDREDYLKNRCACNVRSRHVLITKRRSAVENVYDKTKKCLFLEVPTAISYMIFPMK